MFQYLSPGNNKSVKISRHNPLNMFKSLKFVHVCVFEVDFRLILYNQ